MLACFTGHFANAQSVESLVMPGKVVRGHAEVETDCSSCHKRFSRSKQDSLCLDCHEDIASDVDEKTGFHGRSDDVAASRCAACHTDHEGRNADIVGLNEETFNHTLTDFELIGKHLEATCIDCHEPADKHRDAPSECIFCHEDDDVHEERLGTDCIACHIPNDWTEIEFDHDTTDFALVGKHLEADCSDCHDDQTYQNTRTECVDCHVEDDAHDGNNGQKCATCHSSEAWDISLFDHGKNTDFVLNGSHKEVACADCHVEAIVEALPGTACSSCHLDDEVHDGLQGEQCNDCHDETSWADAPLFDHDLTDFPRLGEHENVECESCHDSQVFASTDSDCVACHLEDDSHDKIYENNCGSCHNPVAWDLWSFDHNAQSDFALNGAHIDVACLDCHRSSLKSMKKTGGRCADCHRADDDHDGEFGSDCGRCHSDTSFRDVRSLQ